MLTLTDREIFNLTLVNMKYLSLILFTLIAAALFSACSYRTSDGSAADQVELSASGSAVTYQLIAIEGHTPPDGGFYELDDSTGRWCERPTAADMMSYARMSGLENPEDVPDLTNFFSDEETRLFKSCRITFNDRGKEISLSLSYNGAVVYSSIVDKAGIPASGNYEIRVKSIKGFDLPEPSGSLLLAGGMDYVISAGSEPAISYTNELGQFFLKFRRLSDSGQ